MKIDAANPSKNYHCNLDAIAAVNGLLPLAHRNRAVAESFKFPGRIISVICDGSCRVAEIKITSCSPKKEFSTLPISLICARVVPAQKLFLRFHFLFSDVSEASAKKRPERRNPGHPKTCHNSLKVPIAFLDIISPMLSRTWGFHAY